MIQMRDGLPVGVSFEVKAPGEGEAVANGRVLALQAGRKVGEALHVEQVEAGTFEVVFALDEEPDFIDALEALARHYGVPVYAKVLAPTSGARLEPHTRALSGLTPDERGSITGVSVNIDPGLGLSPEAAGELRRKPGARYR